MAEKGGDKVGWILALAGVGIAAYAILKPGNEASANEGGSGSIGGGSEGGGYGPGMIVLGGTGGGSGDAGPGGDGSRDQGVLPDTASDQIVSDTSSPVDNSYTPADQLRDSVLQGVGFVAGGAALTYGAAKVGGIFKGKTKEGKIGSEKIDEVSNPKERAKVEEEKLKVGEKPKEVVETKPVETVRAQNEEVLKTRPGVRETEIKAEIKGVKGGKVGMKEVAGYGAGILALAQVGSSYAEARRDIKPQNVKEEGVTILQGATNFLGSTVAFGTGLIYRPEGQGDFKGTKSGWFASEKEIATTLNTMFTTKNPKEAGKATADLLGIGGYFDNAKSDMGSSQVKNPSPPRPQTNTNGVVNQPVVNNAGVKSGSTPKTTSKPSTAGNVTSLVKGGVKIVNQNTGSQTIIKKRYGQR